MLSCRLHVCLARSLILNTSTSHFNKVQSEGSVTTLQVEGHSGKSEGTCI